MTCTQILGKVHLEEVGQYTYSFAYVILIEFLYMHSVCTVVHDEELNVAATWIIVDNEVNCIYC